MDLVNYEAWTETILFLRLVTRLSERGNCPIENKSLYKTFAVRHFGFVKFGERVASKRNVLVVPYVVLSHP